LAQLFNNKRRRGVVLLADGAKIYNGRPVIGIREAGSVLLFTDRQTVIGVDVLGSYQPIYNH
jgi:hypothetical protein